MKSLAQKTVTLKDIAKEVGISPSTVSRAINNEGRVSETTKRRISEAIKKLDYHPNIMARGLASKKTKSVGFVISKRRGRSLDRTSFYGKIIEGVEKEGRKYGYNPIFSVINEEERKSASLQIVKENRVDGLILAGCDIDKKLVLSLKERKIPLVLVDNHFDKEKISCVVTDNLNGAYEAVTYLISLGHKRIGFVAEMLSDLSFYERLQGYKLALKEAGLNYEENLVQESRDDIGYTATKKLLESQLPPSAIFAANDSAAIQAMRAIRKKRLRIPQDIAIVGFDNGEVAPYTNPPLTTVRVFTKEMGQIAMRMLIEIINNKNPLPVKNLMFTELVIRESCGGKLKRENFRPLTH